MSNPETSHADNPVLAKLAAHAQERGLAHCLSWIGGYMLDEARRQFEEDVQSALSRFPKPTAAQLKAARQLVALRHLQGISVSNLSTSVGDNYMRQCRVDVALAHLQRTGVFSALENDCWQELKASVTQPQPGMSA